ncbi:MAG: 5'-nucleotidase C-terminal domain-containing protein [Prevotella sp.]|nr:5'-nucleotidase C-terminal domain-containing protein [Prevotella sp.]
MKKTIITCLSALLSILPMTAKEKNITLRIIQTTDVHGAFFPYDFINRKPKRGSLARVSTYVNRLRSEMGERVILLDNGDILQGQPTCYYYNFVNTQSTHIAADLINYMRYDAQTVGNHDIEPGHEVYDKWIREVQCPTLGANVIDTRTGQPYLKPYTVLEREGVKIAILGLLTPAIPNWLTPDKWNDLRFDDMTATARHWVKHLQENEKPDVIIGLFHSGKEGGIVTDKYDENASLRIAREVPGFDIVFFGHDHEQYNECVTNTEGKTVLCLNPANNATALADAQIDLTLRKGKVVAKKVTGMLADITTEAIDEALMAHFQPHIDEVNAYIDREIGEFKRTIHIRDSYFGNSAFNDFILNLQLQITDADIAFNAPLSFDAAIQAGPVRVSDMFNLYKYENQLFVMRLTGEEIRRHLEMSYNQWVNTMQSPDDHLFLLTEEKSRGDHRRFLGFKYPFFNFDAAAGIDYEVDVTKPDGQKVRILQMSNGQPFDEAKWYRVAVNSYRGNGGGELLTRGAGIPHDSLESRIVWRSERDQRYYLMQEIEKLRVVDPQPNHNWRFVPEEWVKPAAERDRKLLFKTKE